MCVILGLKLSKTLDCNQDLGQEHHITIIIIMISQGKLRKIVPLPKIEITLALCDASAALL